MWIQYGDYLSTLNQSESVKTFIFDEKSLKITYFWYTLLGGGALPESAMVQNANLGSDP